MKNIKAELNIIFFTASLNFIDNINAIVPINAAVIRSLCNDVNPNIFVWTSTPTNPDFFIDNIMKAGFNMKNIMLVGAKNIWNDLNLILGRWSIGNLLFLNI